MRKIFNLTLLALCCAMTVLNAQTPAENLQKGVEIYNALTEYQTGLTPKAVTEENVSDAKNRMDKGIALMDLVIKEGNAEQIRVARYFKTNLQNRYGFVLGMKGDMKRAFDTYSRIEKDMLAYSSSDFPLRYSFFDKNYVIKWDNFATTQAEFLTSFGEVCFNQVNYDEAVRLGKLSLTHPGITPWLRYISINKLLDIAAKKPEAVSETDRINYAVQSVKAYQALGEADKKVVAENNYPIYKRGIRLLLENAQKQNNRESAVLCAEVLPIVSQTEKNNASVLQMYERCYRTGAAGDLSFAQDAERYAQDMLSVEKERATYVGIAAVDQLARAQSSGDCEGLRKIAEYYQRWNQSEKEKQYLKQAGKCLEDRREAEKRAARAAKRADRNFNVYTGAYLFPLFLRNSRRDYGGVVNLVFKKTALEFSYLKINQNRENIFDLWIREVDGAEQDNLSRWDGFYAHFQPKFIREKNTYWGILLGYAEKNFAPMDVTIVRDADNLPGIATFDPAVKQYIGMLTLGGLTLGKGLGADFYWSIGANYSQFDAGTTIDRTAYTINNPLLENRKESYLGFIMRLGMTVGLNFGKGNM